MWCATDTQRAPQRLHVDGTSEVSSQCSTVAPSHSGPPLAVTKSGLGSRPDERHRSTAGPLTPACSPMAVTLSTPSGRCGPWLRNGPRGMV